MNPNVQLVFRGEVLEGFPPEQVRQRLAQALKLDEARVAQLFSGAHTVLKRSVEPALARSYVDKLAALGARVHLEPSDAPPTTGFPPLPDLPGAHEPAPPPWGTQPRPSRPMPLAPTPVPAPEAAPRGAAPSAPVPLALEPIDAAAPLITCPNCGEMQTKRILCRKCSSNIETALATQQEEAARARELRLAERQLRETRRTATDASPGWFGIGLGGRMGRLKYATANLASMGLCSSRSSCGSRGRSRSAAWY
jgi:hypothetical protein